MGQSVTLGGDRLGAGKKNKIYLRNYERSTHNLSQTFTSSMGVGMLIPFMCIYATRDDKFEIDLSAGLRTIPSKAPLFGSFKLQLDVFECDARLYQALLHNNPMAIGLNANQVKFPKIRLTKGVTASTTKEVKTANNSLLKYLGISGIGTCKNDTGNIIDIYRDFDATPVLAYYDIFKNYYANKQEEYAYQIKTQEVMQYGRAQLLSWRSMQRNYITYEKQEGQGQVSYHRTDDTVRNGDMDTLFFQIVDTEDKIVEANIETLLNTSISLNYATSGFKVGKISKLISDGIIYSAEMGTLEGYDGTKYSGVYIRVKDYITDSESDQLKYISGFIYAQSVGSETVMAPFELKEIDDMRMDILSFHSLGESYLIDPVNNAGQNSTSDLTFIGNALCTDSAEPEFEKSLAGILVKTYQNDIYNNWLRTEWIDGDNGINAITAISTSSGKIEIDAINFSEKLYNLLNRVAASDGTYYGYLNAAYTDSAKNFKETPIWLGGYSDEIIFEEIIQTAPTEGQPLGTLGGRGNLVGKHKGGKIVVKVDEPAYIIGIASITPRITYSQGNEWYMTEIDSLADIHVPAMDGIGFENLLAERMHAGATIVKPDGEIEERQVIGKIPAWLNYMTAVDKSYGDFATDGSGDFMVLNRDYNCENGELLDATTYIDPAKFNYAFAYTTRDAQNFWVRIHSDIKARRLMSARQIPSV